ncbi:MAG: amidohydrolase [Acidimicrobiaceae bacterium]|nr:amidohydrolase [Acidimicrobiaceae bacterium]|tara:strand:+ start:119 stop:1804 length:1686 start_codon:yes stop_codon:yes gene_type:complete
MEYELVIRNGTVIDGTGSAGFTADVAVSEGQIVAVGDVPGVGKKEIDATGQIVTPGFVDIHTHFDGQVCWDKEVTPSSWHGVTTIVMGNCGVGFAPVRPGTENELVELMESVEDIPGTALHEGIPWGWQTFAEYLDVIDTPYAIDVAAQAPHVAIRHFVMGERCYDDATAEDMQEMSRITKEALEAGAVGFSTSRFYGHRDKAGNLVPGTNASSDEMIAIAEAFSHVDHGAIEIISDHLKNEDELAWIEHMARTTGRPLTTLVTPETGEEIWLLAERLQGEGIEIRPQAGARLASILMTLEGTVNPMRQFPSYDSIRHLPLEEQKKALRSDEFRQQVLADEPKIARDKDTNKMISSWERMFVLPEDLSYEPGYEDSLAGLAAQRGVSVREALMDAMAQGRPILYLFGDYDYTVQPQFDFIGRKQSVFGLSDGGAHVGVLCDASVPTYMLAYGTRDRSKGPQLPLEFVVHKMTQDTAQVYGFVDRGVIAKGYKADINIIDYENVRLHDPEMVYDLPSGGKRLVQKADGYTATICDGVVTYENGVHTGQMPGRLVRGGQIEKV